MKYIFSKSFWKDFYDVYIERYEYIFYRISFIIKYLPVDIKYGIKNLVRWFPIIWKDRDWDYIYLNVIVHKKLKQIEENIKRNKNHVGWENTVKEIEKSRIALEKSLNDNYYEEFTKDLDNIYGGHNYVYIPTSDNTCSMKFDYLFTKNKEENKIADEQYLKMGYLSDLAKSADIRRAYENIGKNCEKWWD